MFTNLSTGAIRVRATLPEAIALASKHGFAGIDFSVQEAAQLVEAGGLQRVRSLFDKAGVKPGCWGLPVDWQGDEAKYQDDLKALPKLAALGRQLGCTRTATWMLSFSDSRPYAENFEWYVRRSRPIAEILRGEGCRWGIEFIGPKTLRDGKAFEFIYTQDGLMDLARAIGTGNVGLLLDIWHWYTAHGTLADLRKLTNADVVTVHLNDAPAGIPIDEQIDSVRCLPMESGVIDTAGFLKALIAIGYDGPVTTEPFSKKLADMTPDEACRVTADSMRKAWQAAGLSA